MSGDIRTINCTSCGAGLDVLGGGRVLVQVCGYCGAVLDAQDAYKVLAKYEGLTRPDSPLRLGDSGLVQGVEVTVIGTLGMQERWQGRVWSWVEHQVFSPTHGYGWLTVEDGHLVWTRKARDLPVPDVITTAMVERAESRPTARFRGQTWMYYDSGTSEITFLEGAFNWLPKLGDRLDTVTLMGPDAMLSYSVSGTEREVEVSTLLPAATWASFGVQTPPRPRGVHPAQPYVPSVNRGFLRLVSGAGAAIAVGMALLMGAVSGPQQDLGSYAMGDVPASLPFSVTDTRRPVGVTLDTGLSDRWAYFDISVTGPDGETLFDTGREISYFSGGSGEDAWTEGGRSASLVFQPTQAGIHQLEIAFAEGSEPDYMRTNEGLHITAQDGRGSSVPAVVAAVLLLIACLSTFAGAVRHRKRRLAGSDWVEEDDDD
jgi:hypothetical protein